MTVEQIAIRQEVRQMLSEAGINRNTLKDMVKDVLAEEVGKAIKQAAAEYDVEGQVKRSVAAMSQQAIHSAVRSQVTNVLRDKIWDIGVNVTLTDKSEAPSK